MLAVDVGDDGDGRRQQQEAAVTLIGFSNQDLALSHLRIGAEHMNTAADDHRRIEPREAQTAAVIEVVVVFPWLPATAMPYFMRISSASISALGITGISRRRASSTSGFEYLTAVEITTTEGFTVKFSS